MKKRVLSLIMACLMVISTFIISRPLVKVSAVENTSSVSLTAKEFYTVKNAITKQIETVEAYIYLPANYTSRAGVIVGNYAGAEVGGFAFEIYNNGVPRLFWQQSNWNKSVDIKFDSVNVAKGEWLHVAVTRDLANKTAKCYINGELKQTVVWADNYVDDSVLTLLSKRKAGVSVEIYTYKISQQFSLDLARHRTQYPHITVHVNKSCHDRFLIIDEIVYHIGASIKDLGQKLCAVTLLNSISATDILNKLI